jgi:hypothetical protein
MTTNDHPFQNLVERTVVVIVTDIGYFPRAETTIRDIRGRGKWNHDLVVISVGFELPQEFKDLYMIQEKKFAQIDLTRLFEKLGSRGFDDTDHREFNKKTQWEKLHVFDNWFAQWERVIYFDAGFRIVDRVDFLLERDSQGVIIAPNDAGFPDGDRGPKTDSRFRRLVYPKADLETMIQLYEEFGKTEADADFMDAEYFCNCIWIYDTAILSYNLTESNDGLKSYMIEVANRFPLWVSNEMGVMNAVLNVKMGIWREMESRNLANKYMYAWTETTLKSHHTSWQDYCYIKYAISL